MKSKPFETALFENILTAGDEIPWLSPLWKLIYEEGTKENHLLFSNDHVADFYKSLQDHNTNVVYNQIANCQKLEGLIYKLLYCSDLGSMIKIIDCEEYETKFYLFVFYLRVLGLIKKTYKSNLN